MDCFLVGKCQTDPGLVIWMGPRLEIPNGCELGAPHGGFLGQILYGPELGDKACFLVRNCQTDPGLVIWVGPRSEIPNGYEVGAPNRFFVGKIRSDPVSLMWWDVWLENPMDLSSAMGSGN